MLTIAPCRSQISDRFPVASFDIAVPPTRWFEVACATDPRLFHTDWSRHRTRSNFFTSRIGGLLQAPQGHAAYFLPTDQVKQFAGARRIYYALGSYGNPHGAQPEFSISPDALEEVPSIGISPDFTGRTLDRRRLGGYAVQEDAYGAVSGEALRWGGDDLMDAERHTPAEPGAAYDDGHPPDLWREEQAGASAEAATLADQEKYDRGVPSGEALTWAEGVMVPDGDEYPREEDDAPTGYGAPADAIAADDFDEDMYDRGFAVDDAIDDSATEAEPGDYEDAAALYGAALGAEYRGDEEDETVHAVAGHDPAAGHDAGEGEYDDGAAALHDVGSDVQYDDDGYEDAASLYGAFGHSVEDGGAPLHDSDDTDHGGVAVAEAPAEEQAGDDAVALQLGAGRDVDYSEELDEEEELPPGSASRALAVVPLGIPEKVGIVRVVAVAESGRAGYAAINPDNEYNDPDHPAYRRYHIGLSWGLIQFTQRSGALGRVLAKIKEREDRGVPGLPAAHRFAQLFGPDWSELLRVTNARDVDARLTPVGGAHLWEPVWTARFRAAGAVPHVQYAQNEVALTDYVDPNLRLAAWLGFDTARALAMLVDRCIHMGNGGGVRWVMQACGPVRTSADREAALRALGHADLRAFQRSFAPHLAEDGRWGARTHAAMTSALRALGSASPVAVPHRDALLQRMVAAAASTRFKRRLTALYENRTDFSDDTQFVLG